MRVHAFVLHLGRARARRENAHDLLAACGLPAEIWPAVDGAALTAGEVAAALGTRLFAPRYPFALRPGEIGCFLSHRAIWAEIVRRDLDCGLVLEDDVTLDQGDYAPALELALSRVARHGYVQLQDRPPKGAARLIGSNRRCRMTLPVVAPLRTSAQLVGQDAARRLLAASERIDRPVDTFVQSHWHTGLRPAVIHPAGVRTIAQRLDGSSIHTGGKSLSERLWRESARFLYRRRAAACARRSRAPIAGLQR